ncbi:hypothetical protein ACFP56_08145 [Paenibacillus septentrionalis]|uniref:SWIM-type domain-containing protein n=1 Tax=Paenibacillus septentrionalis TaxID=429342 RepID=A0ABW1V236_9BACL
MQIYNQLLAAFDELCQSGNYTAVVKRAWQLYQADAVQKTNVYAKNMVNGIVKDVELHAVVIDSEHIRYSSCTCQHSDFCEHIGALFFQYSKGLENGKVLAEQAYFQLLGVTRASSIQQSESSSSLDQHTNPAELFQRLHSKYGEDWKKCKHSFHPLSQTLTAIKGMAKHSPQNVQRMHWCASILYVLYLGERALLAVDSFSRYYHEMTFKRIAEPWMTSLYEWLKELKDEKLHSFEYEWIRELLAFVYDCAAKMEKPMVEWDYIYYHLLGLLAGNETQQQEMVQLFKQQLELEQSPYMRNMLYGSLAVLKLNEHEDEAAISYFEKCQFEKVQRLIYPVVEGRMQEQQWDKVHIWMDRLLEHFTTGQHIRSVGPYLSLCRKASMLQPSEERWQSVMIMLLPHSYSSLAEHYAAQGQYEQWTDLQMYMGRKPDDFKGAELQSIERHSPEALLPMYHQAIDSAIHSRNRQGYRMAAKYMKKLQGLYEQLEKQDVWLRYFDAMQHKYSRLRAFQEELLKGKLL